jgi:hypothetical protein
MSGPWFEALKRFIFELFTLVLFCITLVRMVAMGWKRLWRVLGKRRHRTR